jgi:Domain of unknown function (DUF4440)
MNDPDLEKELFDLERQYWQSMMDGDAKAATRLSDEPCVVTGAQGVAKVDRATLAKMIEAASWKLEGFVLTNPILRALTDDVAVLAYKVHEDLHVDGQSLSIDAADSSTWVRRDGQWFCAAHSESIAGDPFGRSQRT